MYFNCSAWKKANTGKLRGFLGYILTRTPDGTKYVEKLSKNVKDFKEDAGMRQALLDARAYWDDVAEIAKEEGIEIGREEGIEIGKEFGREEGSETRARETAEALLREGLSEELVAKCTRLSLEEVYLISERISSEVINPE